MKLIRAQQVNFDSKSDRYVYNFSDKNHKFIYFNPRAISFLRSTNWAYIKDCKCSKCEKNNGHLVPYFYVDLLLDEISTFLLVFHYNDSNKTILGFEDDVFEFFEKS